MKPVDDTLGVGKRPSDYLEHGVGQIQGDFLNTGTFVLINPIQHRYDIFRLCSRNYRHETSLPCPCCTISHKRVQFAVRQRTLVNDQGQIDVVREKQPLLGMFYLVPLSEATQDFLILVHKCVSVDMTEVLKRKASHRDVSIRFF